MQQTNSLSMILGAALVLATAGTASAGGKEGSIGVGAEYAINGVTGGISVDYDAGIFHAGGFFGFFDGGGDDDTDIALGGRFYYHVHETTMSDFGVGGTVGFRSVDAPAPGERGSLLFFEPGIQFRAFVANNVALSFQAGISFGLVDASGAVIDGAGVDFVGLAGVHYYFFK